MISKETQEGIVTVGEVVDPSTRQDEHVDGLQRAIGIKLQKQEVVEIDARLQSLVVAPINALPKDKRTVQGRVYSGEEIARAIPGVESFFAAMSRRKEGKFFELNGDGQLVMADGCPEAYGLGEDFPTAKKRQTDVYYRDENGVTQFIQGDDYYTVKEVDGRNYGVRGKIRVLELSEAAKKIPTASIIMQSGLPTLQWEDGEHSGEYVRMNRGQLERAKFTWTDDDSLDVSRAREAYWFGPLGFMSSYVAPPYSRDATLGSRGVLRVNLILRA